MSDEPNPKAVRRIVAHLWGEDFINLRAAVESFGNGWTVVPKEAAQSAGGLRAAATEWHNAMRDGLLAGVSSCACSRGTGETCMLGAALSAEPPATALDWDQIAHDMHRHFWPGSVAEVHRGRDTEQGDCYKCARMGDWLRAALSAAAIQEQER